MAALPLNRYAFHTTWSLAAPPGPVFDALVDLARYPDWWPDVRSVTKVDDDTAALVCRSSLPLALRLRMTRLEEDRAAGRVAVRLTGDLDGTLTGQVERSGADGSDGTVLDIRQHVVVDKTVLRVLSPVAHPIFRMNHGLMMRRGLRACAGWSRSPEPGSRSRRLTPTNR
ncbi:hypothetical protein BJF85_20660, partial [Saccharomonospora sp. CUA-673]